MNTHEKIEALTGINITIDNKLQEVIAKLIQRREIIVITGNAQIQEITNTLAMLGYIEPQQVTNVPNIPAIEDENES